MRSRAMCFALTCGGAVASATVITDPAYFDGLDAVTIDFDSLPDDPDAPADGAHLTDQYGALGVTFASEANPGALQTTDPADAQGRFGAPCLFLASANGGGQPTSGLRYASGATYLGAETSDIRLDFPRAVAAFGMRIVDNDFTDARLTAYAEDGSMVESVIVPRVSEGGVGYWGIAADGVAYVILDGSGGVSLDSTFFDDLTFAFGPCVGDFNGDGVIGFGDLNILLATYGAVVGELLYIPGVDLDGDGAIGFADLNALLSLYGQTCPD